MVYLTGDTHGDIDRFQHGKLRWLGKRDTVVVLGDFRLCVGRQQGGTEKAGLAAQAPVYPAVSGRQPRKLRPLKQYPTEERFGGQVQALGGNVTMCAAAACWNWRIKNTCALAVRKARMWRIGNPA